MKKILTLLTLIFVCSIVLVGCGSSNSSTDEATSSNDGIQVALVMDGDTVDDKSFNQSIFESITEFSQANGLTYNYYKTSDSSEESLAQAIELSIRGGAETVICSSYVFETHVARFQYEYPDIKFIMVDGVPSNEDGYEDVAENSIGILFKEEESGFLAGYAAVKDGYRNIGFMGGLALPSVVRFGYGFVQGVEYAAQELGLSNNDINLNYTYVGNFSATPENAALAASWYNSGTEVIFACGGNMNTSVIKSAEAAGCKVIGVDVDQSHESENVITSAMKNLKNAVSSVLESIYISNDFAGGSVLNLGCQTGDVLLPMETSKFEIFNQEEYEQIYTKIANSEIKILNDTGVSSLEEINLSRINLNVY